MSTTQKTNLLSIIAFCTAAAYLGTPQVLAHDSTGPLGGTKLALKTATQGPKHKFRFVSRKQPYTFIGHSPRQVESWLLLRGFGNNEAGTGKIVLDPNYWFPLGDPTVPKGYKYFDAEGTRGGITKVVLKPGSLSVKGKGENWPLHVEGALTNVWTYFGIENESYCANFGGTIKKNDVGRFLAKKAPAPTACLDAICGNGIVELGEECDDGNLVIGDGCTSACVFGNCSGTEYDSTFAAIEDLVFSVNGCTNGVCHGANPGAGELDLSPSVAYDNLIDVPSDGSSFDRVVPSAPNSSSLYLKLLKAVDPDATDIPGVGMPSGLPPLSEDLLEAVRLWILGGAPETGTVAGTESLLSGCFPEPGPISITPLQPPATGEGVQHVMPTFTLPAETETEVCFATYYDFSSDIPANFVTPSGDHYYSRARITRQDPHSHHMVVFLSGFDASYVNDPSYGTWTCIGGSSDGTTCNPVSEGACGEGICRSELQASLACIGYGPSGGANAAVAALGIGGAGSGNGSVEDAPGFYTKIPIRGILYWNSHAFNLTNQDHQMQAWVNHEFTDNLQHEVQEEVDAHDIYIAAGQAPFTRESYCSTHTYPQGARIVMLSSHTHERGEFFWMEDSSGTRIYESFDYRDPVQKYYDPPIVLDSPLAAERTITYCATYNNGVAADGSPDPTTVRRRSVTPQNASLCVPTACTAGQVGSPCSGPTDHASCDSVPGAGDGFCDACAITAGVSTQDEMFILTSRWYQGP